MEDFLNLDHEEIKEEKKPFTVKEGDILLVQDAVFAVTWCGEDWISISHKETNLTFSASKFTCCDCSEKETCEYAWDRYNVNGDCLAGK